VAGNDDSPFGDDPLDGAPVTGESGGGGLLDDLRAEGEKVVGEEIADLEKAMQKVEHFSEAFAESSVESLQAEWQEIERELKHALRSGLSAAESARTGLPSSASDEAETLRAEVTRKNDLIGQLSETVSRLNREMDETERRLRDELRTYKERAGAQEEELAELRKWSDDLEGREGKLRSELQDATTERDEFKRSSARGAESLATEKTLQDERYAAIQDELKDTNLLATELEAKKKDFERKCADVERRFQTTEQSRAKLETERDGLQDSADQAAKRTGELDTRVVELESDLSSHRKRAEQQLKKLRRSEGRWRGDAETARSRLGEVLGQLRAAVTVLDGLPAAPAADETEPESPQAGPKTEQAEPQKEGPSDED